MSPALRLLLDWEFLEPMQKLYASNDVSDMDKTLGFGMELEEKTIGFYTTMRSGGAAPEQAADLDRIIAEEVKHRRKLEIIRESRARAASVDVENLRDLLDLRSEDGRV